jgi:hypothetical protein
VPGKRVGVVVLGAVTESAVDPGSLRNRGARARVRQCGLGLSRPGVCQLEDRLDVRQCRPAQLQAELVEDEQLGSLDDFVWEILISKRGHPVGDASREGRWDFLCAGSDVSHGSFCQLP